MTDQFQEYVQKVTGTNIDPRSLLSTDYFNHFNTVIMLFSMLPDARNAETMQSWTPIAPHDGHITRMKPAPSPMTAASPGTKNATSAGAKK